jgi:hypothetical protein
MTYQPQSEISEVHLHGRTVIAKVDTFEAAREHVAALGVVMLEDDADHPGCADALLTDGRLIAIQPVGFRLI